MAYKTSPEAEHFHCLECGEEIAYGRNDRKFCSAACKNHWHNKHREYTARGYRVRVLNRLERNHDILAGLLRLNIHSMDKGELIRMGYDFNYLTSCRKVRRRTECCCFELRYIDTETRIDHLERVPNVLEMADAGKG